MKTLPSAWIPEKNAAAGTSPWVFLYELVADKTQTAVVYFRLTSQPEEITFDGKTYYPFPIAHTAIKSDDEGNLPEVRVVLSNVSREIGAYLNIGDGFIGHTLRITVVHKAHLAVNTNKLETTFIVTGAEANNEAVSLACGRPNLYRPMFPAAIITRNRCRFIYKGDGCFSRSPTYTSCGKTLDECIERGNDMVANNLPRIHPKRFGGFPGVTGARR